MRICSFILIFFSIAFGQQTTNRIGSFDSLKSNVDTIRVIDTVRFYRSVVFDVDAQLKSSVLFRSSTDTLATKAYARSLAVAPSSSAMTKQAIMDTLDNPYIETYFTFPKSGIYTYLRANPSPTMDQQFYFPTPSQNDSAWTLLYGEDTTRVRDYSDLKYELKGLVITDSNRIVTTDKSQTITGFKNFQDSISVGTSAASNGVIRFMGTGAGVGRLTSPIGLTNAVWTLPASSGTILLDGDTTLFRTYSDLKYALADSAVSSAVGIGNITVQSNGGKSIKIGAIGAAAIVDSNRIVMTDKSQTITGPKNFGDSISVQDFGGNDLGKIVAINQAGTTRSQFIIPTDVGDGAWSLNTFGILLVNSDSTLNRTFSDSLYGRKGYANIWSGANYFSNNLYANRLLPNSSSASSILFSGSSTTIGDALNNANSTTITVNDGAQIVTLNGAQFDASAGEINLGAYRIKSTLRIGEDDVEYGTMQLFAGAGSGGGSVTLSPYPTGWGGDGAILYFPYIVSAPATIATVDGGQTFTSAIWNGTSIDTAYTNAVSKLTAGVGITVTKNAKDYTIKADTAGLRSIYVPYSGANTAVNLGAQTLTTTGAGSFGALSGTTITASSYVDGDDSVFTSSADSWMGAESGGITPRLAFVKASGFGPELRFLSSSASLFTVRRVTGGTLLAPTASTVDMQIGSMGNVTFGGDITTATGTISGTILDGDSVSLESTTEPSIRLVESGNSGFRLAYDGDGTNDFIIGAGTGGTFTPYLSMARANGALTLSAPQTINSGLNTVVLTLSDVTTDATAKLARFGSRHYTNAEEPVAISYSNNTATTNVLNWGGGTGLMNSATTQNFYIGATNTTVTGTLTMSLFSAGLVTGVSGSAFVSTVTGASPYLTLKNSAETAGGVVLFDEQDTTQRAFFTYDAGANTATIGNSTANTIILDASGNAIVGSTSGTIYGTGTNDLGRYDNYFDSTFITHLTVTNTISSGAITSTGKISADSSFTINERSTTPTVPTSNTQMHYYMKGDKIVWQINNAGTVRYYYFDASATADQSIIYSATAP